MRTRKKRINQVICFFLFFSFLLLMISGVTVNAASGTVLLCDFEEDKSYVNNIQNGSWQSVISDCNVAVSDKYSVSGAKSLHFVSSKDDKSMYVYFSEMRLTVGKWYSMSVMVDSNAQGLTSFQLLYRRNDNALRKGTEYKFADGISTVTNSYYPKNRWITVSMWVPANDNADGGFGFILNCNGESGYDRSVYIDDLKLTDSQPSENISEQIIATGGNGTNFEVVDRFMSLDSVLEIRNKSFNNTTALNMTSVNDGTAIRFNTVSSDADEYYIVLNGKTKVPNGHWLNTRIKIPDTAGNLKFKMFYVDSGNRPVLCDAEYAVDTDLKRDIWQIISFVVPKGVAYKNLGVYVYNANGTNQKKDFTVDAIYESTDALDSDKYNSIVGSYTLYKTSENYVKVAPFTTVSELNSNFNFNIGSVEIRETDAIVKTDSCAEWTIDNYPVKEFNIAVIGDISCDGFITATDLVLLKKHLLGIENLNGAQYAAADVSVYNTAVDICDMVALKKIMTKGYGYNLLSFETDSVSDYLNVIQNNSWKIESKYKIEMSQDYASSGMQSLHISFLSGAASGEYIFFNSSNFFPERKTFSMKILVPEGSSADSISLFYKQTYQGVIKCGTPVYFSDKGDGSPVAEKGKWITLSWTAPTQANIFLNSIGICVSSFENSTAGTEFYVDDYSVKGDTVELSSENKVLTTSELAVERTRALRAYLKSIYGKYTLAGQEFQVEKNPELAYIYHATGKIPALMSFDMAGAQNTTGETTVMKAVFDWSKNCNGIVSLMWHWGAPRDVNDLSKGYSSYKLYDNNNGTTFSVHNAVTPGTPENKFIISDIDAMAYQLKKFKDAGIPVLWRPLHEAGGYWNNVGGGWFWWGSGTSADYIALWNIMYDRMTNYHGLDNLIWVWNGQKAAWRPDTNTFDIAGYDNYDSQNSVNSELFGLLKNCVPDKMLALTEVGAMPSESGMDSSGARWLYWNTWYGDYAFSTANGQLSGSYCNSETQYKENYLSDNVITLDKLPLLALGNKRDVPDVIKYIDEYGNAFGENPKWENDSITLEFEFGEIYSEKDGYCRIYNDSNSSGFGIVHWQGWQTPSSVTVSVDVAEGKQGKYRADIYYLAPFGTKYNPLCVNGEATTSLKFVDTANENTIRCVSTEIDLVSGKNTLGFTDAIGGNGWIRPDCIKLTKISN